MRLSMCVFLLLGSSLLGQFEVHRSISLTMPDEEIFGRCEFLAGMFVRFQGDEIYVLDSSLNKIVRFDKEGRYLSSFVQTGPGPKEVGKIGCFAVSESYVVVTDLNKVNRYVVYDREGSYLKTVRLPLGQMIEGGSNPVLLHDRFFVLPYVFRAGHFAKDRIVIRDLLSGKELARTGVAVPILHTIFGFSAPVVDGNGFWLQLPHTRKLEYFEGPEFNKTDERTLAFPGFESFEPETFNQMVKKNKSFLDLHKYWQDTAGMNVRYFVTSKYLVSFQQFGLRMPVFTIYDKRTNQAIHRVTQEDAHRIEGLGYPVGIFEARIAFYKPGDAENSAGIITLVEIPLPQN